LAVSFEAWQDDVLVGMINAYLNDASHRTGFITNTSILKEYARRGVATTLLQMCLKSALENNFSRVRLEVSRDNSQAIRLYARAGFKIMRENEDNLLMECDIPGTST